MIEYPSISSEPQFGGPFLVWDKLDGRNVRVEWSTKRGFYKLGARKTHLQDDLRNEVTALVAQSSDSITSVFASKPLRWTRGVCFFELYSDDSFAGSFPTDAPKKLALIDVAGPDGDLLDPREFYDLFFSTGLTPKLLLRGNFTKEVMREVNEGTLAGMTFEGVVVKGPPRHKHGMPVLFKAKNRAWLDKVKSLYGEKAEALL